MNQRRFCFHGIIQNNPLIALITILFFQLFSNVSYSQNILRWGEQGFVEDIPLPVHEDTYLDPVIFEDNPYHGFATSTGGITSNWDRQFFPNVDNSGVDIIYHASSNMDDGGDFFPDLYGVSGGSFPDCKVLGDTLLRIKSDRTTPATPFTVILSFSELVFIDEFILGSLSFSNEFENVVVRAFTDTIGMGATVAASTYQNISDLTDDSSLLMSGVGDPTCADQTNDLSTIVMGPPSVNNTYRVIGQGLQSDDKYGRVKFVWNQPVKSIAVSFFATDDADLNNHTLERQNISATLSPVLLTPACIAMNLTSSIIDENCQNNSDGAIDLTVGGGSMPFTYSWTGPGSFTSTDEDISGLIGGSYKVVVTDVFGCQDSVTLNVATLNGPIATAGSNGTICEGEILSLTESGGNAISWLWSGPNGFSSMNQNPNILNAPTIASGIYTVTITDVDGCTDVSNTSATVQSSPCVPGCSGMPGQNIIEGSVFADADQNGVQDAGETGVSNIAVRLYEDVNGNGAIDAGDTLITTTLTNAVGNYSFVDVNLETITVMVNQSSDDGDEDVAGGDAGDVDVTRDEVYLGYEDGNALSGIRFQNITIPQGVFIESAILSVESKDDDSSPFIWNIRGENTDNAATFTDCDNQCMDISNRAPTLASVSWDSEPAWTQDVQYNSPDLDTIIQEIVNRGGWTRGNGLSLFIQGTQNDPDDQRLIHSFDKGGSNSPPELFISYRDLSRSFIIDTDLGTYPFGVIYTTDNIETAAFTDTEQTECENDFGYFSDPVCPGTQTQNLINGTVFQDTDGDGILDGGEVGTAGVKIYAFEDVDMNGMFGAGVDILVDSATTDASGYYNITDGNIVYDTITVIQSADDGEENTDGGDSGDVDLDEEDIEVGHEGGDTLTGFRFQNLNIPQGAVIESAFLRLDADGNDSSPFIWEISGEDMDNSFVFTACTNECFDMSSRTSTSAIVSWTGEPAWSDNVQYNSPDISSIISEIVARPGWTIGNALSLFIRGLQNNDNDRRHVHSFDNNDGETPPQLIIAYRDISKQYVLVSDLSTYPAGAALTTDNVETAQFMATGESECNNNFGFTSPSDVELFVSSSVSSAALGDMVTFTIMVTNTGSATAIDVEATDILPAGFTYVSDNSSGAYNSVTGVWTVGNVAFGENKTIIITTTATGSGVFNYKAEVSQNLTLDSDSTPNNGVTTEDDIDSLCVTIEVPLCNFTSFDAGAPPGLINYQWYRNGVLIPGETDDTLVVTSIVNAADTITFTADDPVTMLPYVQQCPYIFVGLYLSSAEACSGDVLTQINDGLTGGTWTIMTTIGSTITPDGDVTIGNNTDVAAVIDKAIYNKGACVDTVDITVHPSPVPFAFNFGPYCQGDQIQLNAVGGATYSWVGPDGWTSTLPNPTRDNATSQMLGLYNLTATNGEGCTTETFTFVIVFTVVANASGNVTMCEGESTVLDAGTSFGANPLVFTWGPATGLSSTTGAITTATPLIPTTYTVTVTDDIGCMGTDNVTVDFSIPQPDVSMAGNTCVGETLTLTENGVGAVGWSWSGPNSFTSTANSPTINNVSAAADGTYIVTVTDALGCTAVDSSAVTIFNKPTVTATSNSALCEGQTLRLFGNGGGAYIWSGPNSFSSFDQNPVITNVSSAEAGLYTVAMRDLNNCNDTISTVVTVNAIAAPSPITPGSATVCVGDTGVGYSIGAVAGATNYIWTVPYGATIAGGQGTTAITVDWVHPKSTTGQLCVIAENNGCFSSPTCITVTTTTIDKPGFITKK